MPLRGKQRSLVPFSHSSFSYSVSIPPECGYLLRSDPVARAHIRIADAVPSMVGSLVE